MKKYLIPIIFLSLLVFSSLVSAETKTFVKEYSYQASEYDSKVSCRALALEQVKRLLLEELGTYLESDTEVKNFQLTKDQIVTLTAGIVRAEIIEERWDGKTYFLKAKITADPKDVITSIENLRGDRQKTKELEETRRKADEALREVERLKKELEIAKAGKTEQDQYNKAVNGLSAIDWSEKGYALANAGKFQEGIEAYTRAIELDPEFARAYFVRGVAYGVLGDHQQAIRDLNRAIALDPKLLKSPMDYSARGLVYEGLGDHRQAIRDYDKAIELDPKFARAYSHRGVAYVYLGNYHQAIADFDRAIELNLKDAGTYSNRGVAYFSLGNYHQAIADFNRVIELDPKFARAYSIRGAAYAELGVTHQAIRDYDKAITLNPKDALAYYSHGVAYDNLGDHRQAIKDYDRAIELDPKYATAYFNRGICYGKLGNYRQATEDLKIAARLGNKKAQDALKSSGITW